MRGTQSVEPSSWAEELGLSAPGAAGAGGGVKYVFIVNFMILLFLVFHGVFGVGGKFAISQ